MVEFERSGSSGSGGSDSESDSDSGSSSSGSGSEDRQRNRQQETTSSGSGNDFSGGGSGGGGTSTDFESTSSGGPTATGPSGQEESFSSDTGSSGSGSDSSSGGSTTGGSGGPTATGPGGQEESFSSGTGTSETGSGSSRSTGGGTTGGSTGTPDFERPDGESVSQEQAQEAVGGPSDGLPTAPSSGDDGTGFTREQQERAVDQYIEQHPDLVLTGPEDTTGMFAPEEITFRENSEGNPVVGPTADAQRRVSRRRASQSRSLGTTGTPSLAAGQRSADAVQARGVVNERVSSLIDEDGRGSGLEGALERQREQARADVNERVESLTDEDGAAAGFETRQERLAESAQVEEQVGDINWTDVALDIAGPVAGTVGLDDEIPDNIEGDPVEEFVDNTTGDIAADLRRQGEAFEAQAEGFRRTTPANPGMASVQPEVVYGAGAQLGEAVFNTAGEVVRLPSYAMEATEATQFVGSASIQRSRDVASGDIGVEATIEDNLQALDTGLEAVGVDVFDVDPDAPDEVTEYERRLGTVGSVTEQAGRATAKQIRENPEDFAAELVVGAAAGAAVGGAARAARGGRLASRPSGTFTDTPGVGTRSPNIASDLAGLTQRLRPGTGRTPDVSIRRDANAGVLDVDPMLRQQIRESGEEVLNAPARRASDAVDSVQNTVDRVSRFPDEFRGGFEARVTRMRQANRNTVEMWRQSVDTPSLPDVNSRVPSADEFRGGFEARVTRMRQANRNTVDLWRESVDTPSLPDVNSRVPSVDEFRGGLEARFTRARQANRNAVDLFRTRSGPNLDLRRARLEARLRGLSADTRFAARSAADTAERVVADNVFRARDVKGRIERAAEVSPTDLIDIDSGDVRYSAGSLTRNAERAVADSVFRTRAGVGDVKRRLDEPLLSESTRGSIADSATGTVGRVTDAPRALSEATLRVGPARPKRVDFDLTESVDDADLGPFADDSLSDGEFLDADGGDEAGGASSGAARGDARVSSGGGQITLQRMGDGPDVDLDTPTARTDIPSTRGSSSGLLSGVGAVGGMLGEEAQQPRASMDEFTGPSVDIDEFAEADVDVGVTPGVDLDVGVGPTPSVGLDQPVDLGQPITPKLKQPITPELSTPTKTPTPTTGVPGLTPPPSGPPRRPRGLDLDPNPGGRAGDSFLNTEGQEQRFEFKALDLI